MKRLALIVVYLFLLQACASYSPYQPAKNDGFGYRHTQLSETQYRIDFKARDIEQGIAVDYAMLRAAELTIEKGYDWFEVVDRENNLSRNRVTPSVGFSSFSHFHSGLILGAGVSSNDSGNVTVLLEINMGKGVRPDAKQVYSAHELANNLRQSLKM